MRNNLFLHIFVIFITAILFSNCAGIPKSFKEKALDDMYPVLTSEQFQEMKSLTGDKEIVKFIDAYWENADANLGKNRDEYESRLKYANEHFPDRRGWGRSDMKRIYILYGPPSYIEKKECTNIQIGSFTRIKSLEIWLYMDPENRNSFPSPLDNIYRGEMKFIFADMIGSGIYKILYSTDGNECIDARILNQ